MGGRGGRFEWSGIAGCFGLKSSWLESVFRIKEVLVMGWGSDRPVFSLGEQRMEKSLEDITGGQPSLQHLGTNQQASSILILAPDIPHSGGSKQPRWRERIRFRASVMAGLPNCRLMQPENPTCPTALTSFCKMSMQNAASLRTATQTGQTLLLNRDTAFVISGLPHIVLLGEQGNEADFAAHVTPRPRRRRTRAGVGSGMLGIWGAGNAEGGEG